MAAGCSMLFVRVVLLHPKHQTCHNQSYFLFVLQRICCYFIIRIVPYIMYGEWNFHITSYAIVVKLYHFQGLESLCESTEYLW